MKKTDTFLICALSIISLSCGCNLSSTKDLFNQSLPTLTQKETSVDFTQQLSMARLAERQTSPDEAAKVYRMILSKDPDNQEALHRMGVVSGKKGQLDESIEYFEKSLAAGNQSVKLLNDLGYAYYLKDDLATAEKIFNQALSIDPEFKPAYNNLGLVVGQSGRYEEALNHFKEASDDPQAYANLAYIQSQRGDLDLAEYNYHRAIEMDGNLKIAAEALVQVASKTGTRTNVELPENTKPYSQRMETIAENLNKSNQASEIEINQQAQSHLVNNNSTESDPAFDQVQYSTTLNQQYGTQYRSNISPDTTISNSGLQIPQSTYRVTDNTNRIKSTSTPVQSNPLRSTEAQITEPPINANGIEVQRAIESNVGSSMIR